MITEKLIPRKMYGQNVKVLLSGVWRNEWKTTMNTLYWDLKCHFMFQEAKKDTLVHSIHSKLSPRKLCAA
ncbi:unnamed protein product, partial [Tenebrio molitor]